MTKVLKITGGEVTVDDEDYDDLCQFDWCVSQGYAVRKVKLYKNTWANEYMHRRVLRKTFTNTHTEVDHIDRNRLNNSKANLRVCTKAENNRNAARKLGQSGFRGVTHYYDKRKPNSKHRWRVMIHVDYKCISFGYFDNAEIAARVYDQAAIEFHGAFAVLNFPEERQVNDTGARSSI